MLNLLFSLVLFSLTVVIHLIWCRIEKTKQLQVKPFLVITSLIFILNLYLVYTFKLLPGEDEESLFFSGILLYILLIPTYLIFYYSTVIDSPSRSSLILIKKNNGLTIEQLNELINDDNLLRPRLDALVKYGYADLIDKKYRLNSKALLTCRILELYQSLIGRKTGG